MPVVVSFCELQLKCSKATLFYCSGMSSRGPPRLAHLSLVFTGDVIGHFTVVYSVTRPMNGSKAAGDLVSIQTPLFLSCKSCSCDANGFSFA